MLNQHLYSHVSIARDNKKKRICIILSQLCSCLNQSAFMKAYLLKGQYLEHQARRYRQNISESNDIEKSYNQYELLQVQDHEKFQSPVSIYFGALGEKEYDCHTLPENTVKILLTSKRLCCSRKDYVAPEFAPSCCQMSLQVVILLLQENAYSQKCQNLGLPVIRFLDSFANEDTYLLGCQPYKSEPFKISVT